jgi:hypothetical protein
VNLVADRKAALVTSQLDRLCTGDEYGIGPMVCGMLPNRLIAHFDQFAPRGDLITVHRA